MKAGTGSHGNIRLAVATLALMGVCVSGREAVARESLLSLCLAGEGMATPDSLWTSWSFAPEVLGPLLAIGLGYAAGVRRLAHAERAFTVRRQAIFFAAGYGLLLIALVSPLCRLAASLASAHMAQHLILVALAPPLLVLGLPHRLRSRVLAAPLWFAGSAYGVLIWLWHIPVFYQSALTDVWLHLGMYASLLIAAVMFWGAILAGARTDEQGWTHAALMLLTTLVHTGMLGALLSFSPSIWYPLMSSGAAAWGLSALEDQQLAGLIMWVPMGFIYLAAAMALVGNRLARLEARP